MSRCFPFPPPGYENKARTDDADLLTKEKLKEKKHKKEKRDKEKKEGKEKKDKERSKDKQREKKDRKEKHKDKKKDRDRDKDKNGTSGEGGIEGRSEGYNGEKKLSQNSQQAQEINDSKFIQELGRRIRDEERGSKIQMVGTDQRRAEGMGRVVEKDVGNRAEGKEKNKEKKGEDRRADGQGNRDEGKEKNKEKKGEGRRSDGQRNRDDERLAGNARFQNFTNLEQQRVEGMASLVEKDAETRMEGKKHNKDKEADTKRGGKHKNGDREKKSKAKDKDKHKEKEKEEKMKEKSDHKSREPDKSKESGKDSIDSMNIKPSQFSKDSNESSATDENLKKRKVLQMNGISHDGDIRPKKLPRPISSSHLLAENGRNYELCQTAFMFTSDRQGVPNNYKVDNKERKVNGIIEAQPASGGSTKPLITSAQSHANGESSSKPPHPDSKYLSQILSVPKMEEWSDFDDQEWLFSSGNLQSNKPKMGSSGVDETPQVWAEALRIELADVCALPYVIPF